MGADYYSLLDLKRDANDDEIKRVSSSTEIVAYTCYAETRKLLWVW